MSREPLLGGGHLVRVIGGSGLAAEGVPGARRGLVVTSARSYRDGDHLVAGRYRLTRRATAGTDLWRVRRVGDLEIVSVSRYHCATCANNLGEICAAIASHDGAHRTETIVVTRHPALVDLLIERGLIAESDRARVIEHATEDDVRGRRVIGVLPLRLAALAASVTEIPLALRPEHRGQELNLATLREIAGEPVEYSVCRVADIPS